MKLNKSVLVLAMSTVMAAAEAQTPITFDFVFDNPQDSRVRVTGDITFDKDLLANEVGRNSYFYTYGGPELLSYNMIGYAGFGIAKNYAPSDFVFSGVNWMSGGVLDLTRELVGQPTPFGTWGYPEEGGGLSFDAYGSDSFYGVGIASMYTDSYSGSLNLVSMTPRVVTPVPEPETWMMMGAGLGVVGWLARRRRVKAFDWV